MAIAELLQDTARRYAREAAVSDGERSLDFAGLALRAEQLARGLARLGIRRGERVALLSTNRVEYVEAYFALALLGAVSVPVNWRLRAGEVAQVLADCEAVAVIAEARFCELVDQEAGHTSSLRARIALGTAPAGWRAYEACLDHGAAAAPFAVPREDEVAIQMYTSGTTSAPRGAMLTHANVQALVRLWVVELELGPAPDRFLQVTPLFHVGGMLQVMSCAAAGARLRLMGEFLPGPALDVLESEAITHALFVPAMLQWLLAEKDVETRRFPALRLIVYGAAPIPTRILTRSMQVFGCGFLQGYGLTETAGVVTTLRPEDHSAALEGPTSARLASAGRPLSGCQVRTVDDAGRDVAPGAPGEVIVRGPQVSPGYWKRPAETRASFVDGWFHTGDVGTFDAGGYLTIVDRKKDLILVAGENVFPGEVESALAEHPAVEGAAVIGIPHEHWGEEVLALVVLGGEPAPSDRELIQHCRARLARFKCPTRIERRASLPRNSAGKVLKRELREPYWAGRERRV
jgi:long-chain acyl-CoA synthetase